MANVVLHGPYIHFRSSGPILWPGDEWMWALGPIEPGAYSVTAHPYTRGATSPNHPALSVTQVWAVQDASTDDPFVNARVRNVGKTPVDIIFMFVGITTF